MKARDWPPYDSHGACPKCGSTNVNTHYCDGHYCSLHQGTWPPPPEHLDRFCQRCHYGWVERCLDDLPPLAALERTSG